MSIRPAAKSNPIASATSRLKAVCAAVAAEDGYRAVARSGAQPADYHASAADFGRRLVADIEQKAALLRGMALE